MTLPELRFRNLSLVLLLFVCHFLVAKKALALNVFPLRGLFVQGAEGDSVDALIHPLFLDVARNQGADLFPQRIRSRLPAVPETFENKDRRTTLVASLMVARASVYRVEKLDGRVTSLYCAVTAAVHLTNVLTGEVAYSKARTTIVSREVATVGEQDIREGFTRALTAVVDDLVSDVEKESQMREVRGTVIRVTSDFVVIDSGARAGFSTGDTLTDTDGNALEVLHCDEDFCVGRMVFGVAKEGQVISKLVPASISGRARPAMLVLVESVPSAFPELTAQQVFADSFASKAPVAIVPVNPVYQEVLNEISAQTSATQEGLRKRTLPKWFVTLHVDKPITYELRTSETRRKRVTEATATGHIVDYQGRVVATSTKVERLTDEILDGFEVTLEDRQEIAIKNALVEVGTELAKRVKPDRATLSLTANSGIEDPTGILVNGAAVQVFRKVEVIEGDSRAVMVPIHSGTATVSGEAVSLQQGLDLLSSMGGPREGDVIIVDRVENRSPGRLRIQAPASITSKGDVQVSNSAASLTSILASSTTLPIYVRGLPKLVSDLLSTANSFQRDASVQEPVTDASASMTVRLLTGDKDCDDGVCQYQMKCAFQLSVSDLRGAELKKVAMEVALATSGFPQGVRESESYLLRLLDGYKAIRELAPGVVRKVSAALVAD